MSHDHRTRAGGGAGAADRSREAGALGPLVVTEKELELLEAAHRRLLGEAGDPGPAAEPVDGAVEEGAAGEDGAAGEEGAAREAGRSLVLRGLLDAHGALPEAEDDDLGALVATMLDVRLAADRVLVVERIVAVAARQDAPGHDEAGLGPGAVHGTRLVHVLADGACVEDVLPDGSRQLHLLLDPEEVVPWVTDVTVPPDATAACGPPVAVRPDRPEEIAQLLGRPTVLVELSVLPSCDAAPAAPRDRQATPLHHLLALGPSGCWLTQVDPGRSLPERVVFRPVGPGWVARWARSAADPARTGGRRGVGAGQGTMAG